MHHFGGGLLSPATAGNFSISTPLPQAHRKSQGLGRLALYNRWPWHLFWRDWIVSDDSSHQYVLGQTAVAAVVGPRGKARVNGLVLIMSPV